MIEEDRPQCLSIESAKVWNLRLKNTPKNPDDEHGYDFLLKKYKAKNVFELIQLMKEKK